MEQQHPKIVATEDGSPTVEVRGIRYHSIRGARQESEHVFIGAGLLPAMDIFPDAVPLCIYEMGFGTGLNALLTAQVADRREIAVSYAASEAFPLPAEIWEALDYGDPMLPDLHRADWNKAISITPHFTLEKREEKGEESTLPAERFHCMYFDAFAPNDMPELWTDAVFRQLFQSLVTGGLLVTYCSKGVVRRTLKSVGFRVEKIAGPPGKWEMVRAWKDT
jgi:tRNA U34 5-methylaminomethyl-2-thiouridine-forming methyltransferase MnmC